MLIGIATAFLLIFALIAGPKNDPVLVHIDKYAKKIIVDKNRKNLVSSEAKAVKKLNKSYTKQGKAFNKELDNLIKVQYTPQSEFQDFYDKVLNSVKELNQKFFNHRLTIQENITDTEWEEISNKIKKDIKKDEKTRQKMLTKFEKDLEKMKGKISSSNLGLHLITIISRLKGHHPWIMYFNPQLDGSYSYRSYGFNHGLGESGVSY